MRRSVLVAVVAGLVAFGAGYVSPSPAGAQGALVGPQDAYYSCRVAVSGARDVDNSPSSGGAYRVTQGTTWTASCYVDPAVMDATPPSPDWDAHIGSAVIITPRRSDNGQEVGLQGCTPPSIWDSSTGRVRFSCIANWQGNEWYMPSFGVSLVVSASDGPNGSNGVVTTRGTGPNHWTNGEPYPEFWDGVASTGGAAPTWPAWWPSGAASVPPPGSGALPEMACRVELREGDDGQVYADLRASTGETPSIATDSIRWYVEWDGGPSSPRGEPSAPGFRVGRTPLVGGEQLGVLVPEADMPPSGWYVQAVATRTYASPVTTTVEYQEQIEQGETFDKFMANLPGRFATAGTLGLWRPDEIARYEFVDAHRESSTVVAWESASAVCPLTVNRSAVGTPEAGQVAAVGETPRVIIQMFLGGGWGEGSGDGGGGGGSEACGPSGWGWVNPLEWGRALACVVPDILGDLLSAIGDLLGAFLDLVPKLLSGLADLFIPDGLDFGWSDLKLSAEGKAPFAYIGAVTSTVDDVLDQDRSAACVPVGISEETEQCLEGPDSSMPGVTVLRNIFSVTLWLGVGTRILRTAPWAKGRDGAEVGG